MWKVGDCVWVVIVLLHPHRKWVMALSWGCGGRALMAICAFWCCWGCVVLVVVFVDFWWASSGQSKFVENWCPWGTGWCCCGCILAPPFQPNFWHIGYIKCTFSALAATPLQQMEIKCAWLDIFYYMYHNNRWSYHFPQCHAESQRESVSDHLVTTKTVSLSVTS